MKKFSFVLAIIAGIILLSGCTNKKATEDNWSTIKEEKKVIVGLDDTFVPMGLLSLKNMASMLNFNQSIGQ